MRFIIMHKTGAHWESGAIPGPELIARVGRLLGELAKAHVLLAGEGLRPSSEGVRLRFAAGARTVIHGPFEGDNELPSPRIGMTSAGNDQRGGVRPASMIRPAPSSRLVSCICV